MKSSKLLSSVRKNAGGIAVGSLVIGVLIMIAIVVLLGVILFLTKNVKSESFQKFRQVLYYIMVGIIIILAFIFIVTVIITTVYWARTGEISNILMMSMLFNLASN